jgi:periplasmic protein TonB
VFIDLSDSRKTDRLKAGAVAFLFEAALGYALIVGLGVQPPAVVTDQLKMVGLLPDHPPPPPKVVPPPKRTPEKEGAASPPNLRSKPTEIVRPPPPPLPLPVPPPVAAAPIAGPGAAPNAGAAPVPGPGTGSGGLGNGTGSGNGGNGGGGGGMGSGPRWVKGRIKDKDYPRSSGEAGVGGVVTVRYVVEPDGRAANCVVVRSSGHADLDETTCRLIEERFRYKPARDRNGRPVPAIMEGRHEWIIGEPPRDDDDRDDGQ